MKSTLNLTVYQIFVFNKLKLKPWEFPLLYYQKIYYCSFVSLESQGKDFNDFKDIGTTN
jgi:hypothetical protein